LQLSVGVGSDGPRISISRPAALRAISDADLFGAVDSKEAIEAGFSLRLARGLARISGGELLSSRDSFALAFSRG
ncbi:MAG: hypothetical protein ACJ8FS_04325, partial [Sphingomicrobium sp.]